MCPHGYVFEGRGFQRSQAAQPGGNTTWTSVTFMIGGRERPGARHLQAWHDLRAYLRARGVGSAVRPHSSFISTSCPGSIIRGLINNGTLRSGSGNGSPVTGGAGGEDDMSLINLKKGDGEDNGRKEHVIALQSLIKKAGGELPTYGVDGDYGDETAEALRRVRASVGSAAKKGWGNRVSGHAFAQLMQAVAKRQD